MKNTLRYIFVFTAFVLCAGLLAACGTSSDTQTQPSSTATPATQASEPFAAPPDDMGKVVSADSELITWNDYAVDDETIDFMGVDVDTLKEPNKEMSIVYLEDNVSYYLIRDGKLVDAAAEDVVPGAVIGITTLEKGVQEVYILLAPEEDLGYGDSDTEQDILIEIEPATAATEESVPEVYEDTEDTEALDTPES